MKLKNKKTDAENRRSFIQDKCFLHLFLSSCLVENGFGLPPTAESMFTSCCARNCFSFPVCHFSKRLYDDVSFVLYVEKEHVLCATGAKDLKGRLMVRKPLSLFDLLPFSLTGKEFSDIFSQSPAFIFCLIYCRFKLKVTHFFSKKKKSIYIYICI